MYLSLSRAWSSEPGQAQACPNFTQACFGRRLFTNISAKIQTRAYLKIRLAEPRAWGLFTASQNSARAYEPKPRLIPPLVTTALTFTYEPTDQGEHRRRVAALHVQAARVQKDDHAVGQRPLRNGLRGRLRALTIPGDGPSNPGPDRSPGKNLRPIFR